MWPGREAEARRLGIDLDDDMRDGLLFRFWIRMASYPGGSPSKLIKALHNCTTVEQYRAALMQLAKEEGINLP